MPKQKRRRGKSAISKIRWCAKDPSRTILITGDEALWIETEHDQIMLINKQAREATYLAIQKRNLRKQYYGGGEEYGD